MIVLSFLSLLLSFLSFESKIVVDPNTPKRASIHEALTCPGFEEAQERNRNRLARIQKKNSTSDSRNKSEAKLCGPGAFGSFSISDSGSWSASKLLIFINALCQQYGIKNWSVLPTTGERRAIKENRDLCDLLQETLGYSREQLLEFFKFWFDNWPLFTSMFKKAEEVGYCPPFWLKAASQVKKFRDLYYLNRPTEVDSTQPHDGFTLE